MRKTLIVVDMQNDFIDGALGTKEAVAIVPNVKKKIEAYIQNGDEVIFTRDTHHENYLETSVGFTYRQLNEYIRTRRCDDPAIRELIDKKHRQNLFKLQLMPSFKCEYLTSY